MKEQAEITPELAQEKVRQTQNLSQNAQEQANFSRKKPIRKRKLLNKLNRNHS